MKKKSVKILSILIILALCIAFNPIKIYAVLQSNGESPAVKNIDSWILQIRQMQSSGGSLGLTDSINTSNLSSNNNNLDIHMIKNTEYGAMILLSASPYGNPNKIQDGQTTTGNNSGVVMRINKEWVAAGAGLTSTAIAKNAIARYINNDYGTTSGGKYHAGDAMNIGNWHSSGATGWFSFDSVSGLYRAYAGSIFSYNGAGNYINHDAYYYQASPSRAAVVVGSGI